MSAHLTERQAVVLSCFTGVGLAPFDRIQAAVEEVLERPVYTHEFADHALWAEIKDAVRDEAMAMLPWPVGS